MADRSRRKVRIGDTHKAAAAEEAEARDHWSSVPVEVNVCLFKVFNFKPTKVYVYKTPLVPLLITVTFKIT